jgi:hypothetical protein
MQVFFKDFLTELCKKEKEIDNDIVFWKFVLETLTVYATADNINE